MWWICLPYIPCIFDLISAQDVREPPKKATRRHVEPRKIARKMLINRIMKAKSLQQ